MMTRASVVLPLPLSPTRAQCLPGAELQVDAVNSADGIWLNALQGLAQAPLDREALAQIGHAQ